MYYYLDHSRRLHTHPSIVSRMPSSTQLASVGIVLSMYALYVEHKVGHLEEDEDFTALCDIEAIQASCSSVFQLPEGKMLSYFGIIPHDHRLDVPNAALGILYYTYMLTMTSVCPVFLTQIIASMAMGSSLFLAYKLTILRELCILCWTTHVLNACLWWKTSQFAAHDIHQKKNKTKTN